MAKATIPTCFLILAASASFATARAGAGEFASTTRVPNPRGCRAFNRVVDPACPYDAARLRCESARSMLGELGLLGLRSRCEPYRRGFWLGRLGEDLVNRSASFDGYELRIALPRESTDPRLPRLSSRSVADSSCRVAARALDQLRDPMGARARLKASCDRGTLSVESSRD